MNWSRARLKEMARVALHGSYWKSVLVAFILALTSADAAGSTGAFTINRSYDISGGGNLFGGYVAEFLSPFAWLSILSAVVWFSFIAIALRVFFFQPLEVGGKGFFNIDLYRPAEMSEMGRGFGGNYWNIVKIMFFKYLFTFLWTLLFVIPGIVKAYEYMMIPYLLSEDPDMPMDEAFRRSKEMMMGEKWRAFVLDLSFIGWHILGGITFGIVEIFYVRPYLELTHAGLYGALKQKMQRGPYDY